MKPSAFLAGALGALLLALAAGCTGASGFQYSSPVGPDCNGTMPAGFPTTASGIEAGQTGPDVALQDLNGNPVCLRGYAGEVVLVNTGAGWCPPCQAEARGIQQLYEKYRAQGFEVLMAMYQGTAQGSDPNQSFMNQWAQAYGITFLLLPDRSATFWKAYARPDDALYPPPGYVAFPLNVVLDRDQVVRYSQIGGGSTEPAALDGVIDIWVNTPATLPYPTPTPTP